MSASLENTPIRPALVAAKLAKIRNFEDERLLEEFGAQPRLIEALWFLQFMSMPENNPGGLRKFAADLISDSIDLIGPLELHEDTAEKIGDERLRKILEELPKALRDELEFGDDGPLAAYGYWGERNEKAEALEKAARKKQATRLVNLKRKEIVAACCQEAVRELPIYLRALCEQLPYSFHRKATTADEYIEGRGAQAPRYFPRIAEALLRFMDRRKTAVSGTIASTAVSREVFHWLHKARDTRSAVIIEGNSRWGKTESARAWANMHPGLARYVRTPPSNSESDLLRAIATALGMDVSPTLAGYRLRGEVEYVLIHSGLMPILDEAHAIFPASYSRNTTPARLNWIRCNVLDCGLPAVFISTPQSYRNAEKKFVKATGFAMEQFSERILKTVHLPSEVSAEDLFAIARIHFPGLPDKYLEYVVERAAATERNYVSDVSKIARLAYSNAADDGLSKPKLDHLILAINDVLPALPLPILRSPRTDRAAAVQAGGKGFAERRALPVETEAEDIGDLQFDRSISAGAEALLPG